MTGTNKKQMALARYRTDGSLDPTFGTGGRVLADFASTDYESAHDVALNGDGKIVAAGTAWSDGAANGQMAIARFTAAGALDTTYDSDGKVLVSFPNAAWASAESVLVDSNQRVTVGGVADRQFALARTLSTGALDSSFDGDGRVRTNFSTQDSEGITALAFSASKIVAVGSATAGNVTQFAGAVYLSNGQLDTSFDGDGKVLTDFASTTGDQAFGVFVASAGKIVAAGMVNHDPSP
jgi:uncharacterized delta-60 repeat protein